jgi:hypothetical protein
MTRLNVTIKQSQKNVPYTMMENGSKKICFMLSGTGYTYDKPLLYYATMLLLENEFDLVHINYSYEKELFDKGLEVVIERLEDDVDSVFREVLEESTYEEIMFLGKSLGSIPLISKYIQEERYSTCKTILLTPLLKFDLFFDGVMNSSNDMLVVIGNKDSHFIDEKIEKLQQSEHIDLLEIANANHSLEIEPTNTMDSLKAMFGIIEKIRSFIN